MVAAATAGFNLDRPDERTSRLRTVLFCFDFLES